MTQHIKGLPQLSAARLVTKYTQRQLAAEIGCTHAAISQFEQGKTDPSLQTCLAILDALAARGLVVSVEWLAGRKQ